MANVPIKITAETRTAIKRVQGMVAGMKKELGKLATVGVAKGMGAKEIGSIVQKAITGQKNIQNEVNKTAKSTDKAGKSTENWLNSYRKLAAVAKRAGEGSKVSEKTIRDMRKLVDAQVTRAQKKGAGVSEGELAKLEGYYKNIDDLSRATSLTASKAHAEDQKRAITAQ